MSTTIHLQGKNHTYKFSHPQDRIGEGNLAFVYRGTRDDQKVVAVKVLKKAYSLNPMITKIYEKAVDINLDSDHLTKVYDYVVTGSSTSPKHHLIIEFVQGMSFDQVLDKNLSIKDVLKYTRQLLQGLSELHSLGYLHRDIKPSNFMLGQGDFLKITDYDTIIRQDDAVAKAPYMGTYNYSSPEQIQQEKLDPRTDIWSAGIFLYRALIGKTPFEDIENKKERKEKIVNGDILIPTEIDLILEGILRKAITPDKSMRYSSAMEMRMALENYEGIKSKWWFKFYNRYFLPGSLNAYAKVILITITILLFLTFLILLHNG